MINMVWTQMNKNNTKTVDFKEDKVFKVSKGLILAISLIKNSKVRSSKIKKICLEGSKISFPLAVNNKRIDQREEEIFRLI